MEFQVTPWVGIYSVALAVTMVLVGYAVWNYRTREREPLNFGLATFMLGVGLVQLGTLVAHIFVEPGVNVYATNVINALFFPTMVFGFV